MKKLILCLFLTSFFLNVKAQAPNKRIETEATLLTRTLANNLQLNEQGYLRLKGITTDYLAEKLHLEEEYSYNPELQELKLNELENIYQRRILLSLKSNQLDLYLAGKKQNSPRLLSSLSR